VRLPRAHFSAGGGYRWATFTVFVASHGTVVDRAPNRRLIAHDAFGPLIELLSFPDPSTVASNWNTVHATFSIADTGRHATGIRRWTVQSRRDAGPWETWGWLEGGGEKTVVVGGEEGVNWSLRVVARDRHGNTTVSPVRRISIPYDNSNGVFAGAWSGSWEGVYPPPGSPYMLGLVATSVPGSAFTHTFTGSSFLWIAPGAPFGGPGTASVTIDGGDPITVEQSAASGDRAIIFEATGLDPGIPHTVVITHQTGVISVDAVVIR
jgi:hypothetical protein